MDDETTTIKETLEQFANIVPKTKQGLRLFKAFYKIRFKGYKKLGRKFSLNIFKSKLAKDLERQKILDILRTNNERERKVFLDIYANAYNELKPLIELLSKRWKKECAELNIMQKYFEEVFTSQKLFLDKESLFLEGKISQEDFASSTNDYFTKLEEMNNIIVKQYGSFYSPIEFEKSVKERLKNKIITEADSLGFMAIFVGLFVGVNNFNHAMPEQLLDIDKLPSAITYLEFILICFVLTKLNAPVFVWQNIKEYSKKTVYAIATI